MACTTGCECQKSVVESKLPTTVKDFVIQHITSVEELEILLFLHAERQRSWSVAEVNAQLRSQESSVAKWLALLANIKLVTCTSGATARYQFPGDSETLAEQTAAVAAVYNDFRVRIIELIYSKPADQLLNFSNAFNLRKRHDG
jgi:hypothetical protein